ncbi:MAG: hypothetical protein AAGA58_11670, partial [Verrucomicrobiota bacterium]
MQRSHLIHTGRIFLVTQWSVEEAAKVKTKGYIYGVVAAIIALSGERTSAQAPVDGSNEKSAGLFESTMKHVDFGGPVFAYLEVRGDMETLANGLQKFSELEELKGKLPPGQELNFPQLLETIGLGGIEALAMSSLENENGYLNKAFMKLSGPRKGLLAIPGGQAGPFLASKLVPKDADFVLEGDLKLSELRPMMDAFVALADPEIKQTYEGAMQVPLPVGMTAGEVLAKANIGALMFGRIDPEGERIPFPQDPSFKVPAFDAVFVIEGLTWVVDSLVQMAPPHMQQVIEGEKGSRKFQLPPFGPGPFERIQFAIIEDAANDRIVITSSPTYWQECEADSPRLGDNADFREAMSGLPEEGNGLGFVSRRLKKEIEVMLLELMNDGLQEQEEMPPEFLELMETYFSIADMPEAVVYASLQDGIFFGGNNSATMAEVLVPYGGISLVAILSATAFPAMNAVLANARLNQAMQEGRAIYVAVVNYAAENDGQYPESLAEL